LTSFLSTTLCNTKTCDLWTAEDLISNGAIPAIAPSLIRSVAIIYEDFEKCSQINCNDHGPETLIQP